MICPYCSSESADLICHKKAGPDSGRYFETKHSLYRCADCDLFYSAPITSALLEGVRRYFEAYNVIRHADHGVGRRMVTDIWGQPWWRYMINRQIGLLRQAKWRVTNFYPDYGFDRGAEALTILSSRRVRSVLDVGCSYGGLVKYAWELGFDSYGVEPTSEIVDLSHRTGPAYIVKRITQGFFPEQHGPRRRYDALTFMHVLTHFSAVTPSLFRQCAEAINPGGALLIFATDPAAPVAVPEVAFTDAATFTHMTAKFAKRAAADAGFSSYEHIPCVAEPYCSFHVLVR